MHSVINQTRIRSSHSSSMVIERVNIILKRLSHVPVQSRLKPAKNGAENFWDKVPEAPRDPILSINALFQQDPNVNKVNLSIGTYRTEDNQPQIFSSVQKADKIILERTMNASKEYNPMEGYHEFNQQAYKLLFGFDKFDKFNVTVQTFAGTGALDLGATFLSKFFPGRKEVFVSNPSWINHYLIFKNYNFRVSNFSYYDFKQHCFDADNFFADLERMPEDSVILLQPCGHNPTGTQPRLEHWSLISKILQQKRILPFFDIAYHGLCSGSIEKDSQPIRLFAEDGHQMLVAQTFSKNMALYGRRIGALTILADDENESYKIASQLKSLIISKYICPPSFDAQVVSEILSNKQLKNEWISELQHIAFRLGKVRAQFRTKLEFLCPSHNWSHVTDQSGIFWFTGLTNKQVERMIRDFSVYLPEDGRLNIAGINEHNMNHVARVIQQIIKQDS